MENMLGWVLFGVGLLAGLLLIPLGLGGTFVILGVGVVTGFITEFSRVEWLTLVILAILAVIGEIIESILGIFTVRKFGASRAAMFGTFFGGLVGGAAGTGLMPVIGSLIGAFVGAFLGAVLGEFLHRRKLEPSLRAGWAAFVGRVIATAVKFEIGVLMIIILVWRVVRTA